MRKIFILLTIFFFSLLFLFHNTFAQDNKAHLLGLAIVEDVSEDEYGLTVLDGLFSIIEFKKFPAVDSFKIYSRWTGIGEHKIRVQIVDDQNNVIKTTEDEDLALEEDFETYYYIHDFNNTVFQKPGVYRVQAILDDNVEFEIPLFIHLSGQEVEFKLKSEEPLLIFSVPAIEVYEKHNGLQVVSGAFEYFAFKEFPGKEDFIITNGWYSGEGKFQQHTEVLDPDGKVIYKSDPQSFETSPKSVTALYDELTDFEFSKPGMYVVKIYLEDKPVLTYPILVKQRQ
ncbi:MAG: DUF6941 family protein [Dictyoglomus sp.]|jgi:hypothetical protein|uniref:DUF6941 family protein n=1 Tax=Dictyoglomus sp. TaxID=28205 RepID=UPI000CCF219F|nr:MAG: hypothetical protein C0196_02600 [Dictyoglomus turgidum]